jgi:hypothetical protein
MALADELSFADQIGRFGSRHWGMSPMSGRVLGWLMICDPPEQTAADLAEVLKASRSAISTAIATLEPLNLVERSRAAGERVDRIRLHPLAFTRSMEQPEEYGELADLARQGRALFGDSEPGRIARLAEIGAFAEFLGERMPQLRQEWEAHRDALRASGALPDPGYVR